MHVVIRLYSGEGARELFEMLETRRPEIEEIMRGVPDFRSYTLVRTASGGASVTACEDKHGTDWSSRLAHKWISENAANLNIAAPNIAEGEVILELRN
ncbi:hypothetical protein LNKW23_42710 [Paralimibaculum aggregatum]|uniref:ABM domain-containing protein n=1 Tax=Paralimibaculum aggregatum TaxID=3036245 RepID=A0ABQ6LSJ3_9RHOB|nr:hypothetical protein [Limibaculum sp. NKW23]GMG85055.1 hypothetical protein LNKW23_42710 [Limibaculum sp. NKW23]